MTDLQHTLSNGTDQKKKCSSDPMSYCLCLGTWKTTLPSLLSTSCDYFWQMSHEHTGHLPLLVRSNGRWLCDYSDFLFLGSKCLGETHFLSWQNHRWKQSAFLFPKWNFFVLWWVRKKKKKLCLCWTTEIWGCLLPKQKPILSQLIQVLKHFRESHIFVTARDMGIYINQSTDLKPDANRQSCKLGKNYYKLKAWYVGPGTSDLT